jgi:hypothetical protein
LNSLLAHTLGAGYFAYGCHEPTYE